MSTRPPNILLFLTDDHGKWAAGCYGNSELHTPNLDYLASRGVRMDQAYTPSPVCSPARASLFTGRLPSQHGIHDWLKEGGEETTHPGLDHEVTLPQLLQNAGYYTGLVGKWHCGKKPRSGFDYWTSYLVHQYPHFGTFQLSHQGNVVTHHGHQAPILTEYALDFLRNRPADRPFFLTVGYVNTHTPHKDQPERWVTRYRRATFRDIPDEEPPRGYGDAGRIWLHAAATRREELAQYYASVSFIDEQIGRILDELDAAGELERTFIVYVSDHGHMNGHHGLHGKGNATRPQNFLDESIQVPCLLAWPSGLPAGRVIVAPVDHCDLFCTLLDAAGVSLDPQLHHQLNLPGRSYLSLMRGDETEATWRDTHYCEYGNARMIRTPSHKLIVRYPGPNGHFPDELYDLELDPRETTNRIDDPAYRQIRAELRHRLETLSTRYEVPSRSGRHIASQPRCNPSEPWRSDPR